MVATSSAAAQASENEKRRKQTMEKVKANHLSRQLQMRLQYARLKVEHGWQKQNLNEVENLYFHNSHLRGSKPFTLPTIITTQPSQSQSPFSATQPCPAQSSLSFKLASSSLGRNVMNVTPSLTNDPNTNAIQDDTNGSHTTQPISIPNYSLPVDPVMGVNPLDLAPALTIHPPERNPPSLPPTSNSDFIFLSGHSEDVNMSSGEHSVPIHLLFPPEEAQSPIDSVPSSNHYPSIKPSRPRTQKAHCGSKGLPLLTAKDMYSFGPTSTLTYDSFWSSHSGSTASRPTRNSTVAESVPTFQVPGDFTSGISDLGRSNSSSSTYTSLSSLQSQQ